MKEQIIVGILALSLAVGFIFSIEMLAHWDRPYSEHISGSCLAHSGLSKMALKKCSEIENCVNSYKRDSNSVVSKTNETNICMVSYN